MKGLQKVQFLFSVKEGEILLPVVLRANQADVQMAKQQNNPFKKLRRKYVLNVVLPCNSESIL